MVDEPADRSRRILITMAAAVAAALLGAAAVMWIAGRGNDTETLPEASPLQLVLREIREDGTWSQETALRAFAAVFGPLPGVVMPEGVQPEGEFGTVAVRMLALYFDDITPEQKQAALRAAGPIAHHLTGELREGPDASRSVGLAPGVHALTATVLAADGSGYEAMIADIVTSIEDRVHRPLGLEVEVVIATEPSGILYATAGPIAPDKQNITGCEVTVLPNAQNLSGKNLTAVLAHETWHCFEFSRLGTMSRRTGSPPWIMEGQAMWVGEAFVGGSNNLEPAVRHWKEYLIDPGLGVGLFNRSYDAVGFYSHLHDEGIDPWTILDPVLDATSNVGAFNAAVGAKALDVVTTWAPSWYRDGQPTSTFALVNAPGILPATIRPIPASFTISDGTFNQVSATQPLSAAIADVAVAAEILTIDVSGQAVVGDMVFGDEIVIQFGSRTFCMRGECSCPDGSVREAPADHLGDELRVAVTGDALSGADALLRGWSRDEWCEDAEAFPPGDDGTPCQGGCGSSNGDPHLTTVDGVSYDFQAAGEFTLLRSPDGEIEVQARQEPYQDSKAVTINTGVAVAAGDRRAAVYAGRTGLTLFVDGVQARIDEAITTGALQIRPVPDGIEMKTGGTTVWALGIGEWGLNVLVSPSPELRTSGVGLLSPVGDGTFPKLPDGGAVDADGDYLTALYVDLADAWAVTEETTLFDYTDGAGPESFRDRSIPEPGAPLDFADLAAALQELGLEACSGIEDELLLLQCAFDFAVTEDSGFVDSYESTDVFLVTVIEEQEGSIVGGPLNPLLTDLSVIAGAALDGDGTVYLSVRYSDERRELVAIDPVSQTITARVETEDDGQVAVAAGSVWMSGGSAGECAVRRFAALTLTEEGSVDVRCLFDIIKPQIVAVDGAVWVYVTDGPSLRRIDPTTGELGDDVPLPFGGGFLRGTDSAVFYSDFDEGIHRWRPGEAAFEEISTDWLLAHPGGDGFWVESDGDTIAFFDSAGPAAQTVATDGNLVGATGDGALVERSDETGRQLWVYPVSGSAPRQVAAGPVVGTGAEERQLDYFDDYPPIAAGNTVVKVWLEFAEGAEETAVFVQAIDAG
jgi:hypothetical protein